MVIPILLEYMLHSLMVIAILIGYERIFIVVIAILRRDMKKFIGYERNKYAEGKHCQNAYSKSGTAWMVMDYKSNFTGKF